MHEFDLQLGEPLDDYIGKPFHPANLQQDDFDLESLFSEPLFGAVKADPSLTSIVNDAHTASSDPVCFCKNPLDGVTYLFNPNTQTAYPLHPNMAAVVYSPGCNLPYPEITADQVSRVFADSRRKPQEEYQITPSGLILPPFSPEAQETPPVQTNSPASTVQLDTMPGSMLCPRCGADVGLIPYPDSPLAPPSPVNTEASALQLVGLEVPARSTPRKPPRRSRVQARDRPLANVALSRYFRMNFDASKVYPPLPSTPPPWGQFTYNRTGELVPQFLSVTQIIDFLYLHPLHYNQFGIRDPKNSGLEIFIQRVPADSSRRYPLTTSNLCRFDRCFMSENTINIGHFRVCFSEKRTDGLQNPYHNAGYVHLFCIENFLNFPQLVLDLNVKADTRKFETEPRTKGPGPMELDRTVKTTVLDFIADCQTGYPADYPSEGDIVTGAHEGTLTHRLHIAKLEDENPVRARVRSERGGIFTHDSHLGNLRNIQAVKAHQRNRPPPPATPPEPQTPKAAAPQPTPQLSPPPPPPLPSSQPSPPSPPSPASPPPAAPRKRGRPKLADSESTRPTKTRKIAVPVPEPPPPDPTHRASDALLAMQESVLREQRRAGYRQN